MLVKNCSYLGSLKQAIQVINIQIGYGIILTTPSGIRKSKLCITVIIIYFGMQEL